MESRQEAQKAQETSASAPSVPFRGQTGLSQARGILPARNMFTTRNAIRLALIQVGVIVAGILAAGVGYHSASGMGGSMPASTLFLVHFGFLLLALPVAWITFAARLQKNGSASDRMKTLTFIVGLAMLVVLTLFSVYAAGEPWMGGDLWPQGD
jgi:hypothetical protein